MRKVAFFAFLSVVWAQAPAMANVLPATPPPAFSTLTNFPSTSAGYGIVATALSDGRFALYDGDAVWLQASPDSDWWLEAFHGYIGDPAFIAASPDGHTLILGAGYLGDIYKLDLNVPKDYTGSAYLTSLASNYSGAFLDETLLLVDAARSLGSSEIYVVDVASGTTRKVIDKPGYSANIALNPKTAQVFLTNGETGEVRVFSRNDLIRAFQTATTLAWTSGEVVGAGGYGAGGAGGVSEVGTLLIGSYDDHVQFVDSSTGAVAATVDPDSSNWDTYVPVYNPVTKRALIIGSVWVGYSPQISAWVSEKKYEPLPAAGGIALALAGGGVGALGYRRLRRRR